MINANASTPFVKFSMRSSTCLEQAVVVHSANIHDSKKALFVLCVLRCRFLRLVKIVADSVIDD